MLPEVRAGWRPQHVGCDVRGPLAFSDIGSQAWISRKAFNAEGLTQTLDMFWKRQDPTALRAYLGDTGHFERYGVAPV